MVIEWIIYPEGAIENRRDIKGYQDFMCKFGD